MAPAGNLLIVLAVFAPCFGGCASDQYQMQDETRNKLHQMKVIATTLIRNGEDLSLFTSTHSMINHAMQKEILKDAAFFAEDSWNNEWIWRIDHQSKPAILRIASCGQNGVDERGEGDDIVIEILLM